MSRQTFLAGGAAFALAAAIGTLPGRSQAAGQSGRGWTVNRGDTYQIAQLTGPESINDTHTLWNIYGTDLGHMFEHGGSLYMVCGDTFGYPGKPPEFGEDGRSNAMAWTRDANPVDGITFDGMVNDPRGHAKELIPQEQDPGEEVTIIPTYGVSTGSRMFLHYMAVREWGPPGRWWLNRSGLAYSDDDGQTWALSDVVWPAESNFGQVAIVEVGKCLYLFGIPGGRFGGVELARVKSKHILDMKKYDYWDGRRWSHREGDAATVTSAPVGELSAQWSSYYRQWLMTYLNEEKAAVVLRTADCLTGPWSGEQTVVTTEEVPSLYAPYAPPRWNDGPDIYFAISRFDVYDVFWWHTSLEGGTKGDGPERCVSGKGKEQA